MTGFGKGTDLHNFAVVGNLPNSPATPRANPSWSIRLSPTAVRIGAKDQIVSPTLFGSIEYGELGPHHSCFCGQWKVGLSE